MALFLLFKKKKPLAMSSYLFYKAPSILFWCCNNNTSMASPDFISKQVQTQDFQDYYLNEGGRSVCLYLFEGINVI